LMGLVLTYLQETGSPFTRQSRIGGPLVVSSRAVDEEKCGPRQETWLGVRDGEQCASDRVASGRYRPEAPTDPSLLALGHTVLPITGSLPACKSNARCARRPAGSAGAGAGNGPSSSRACGCGDRATSASAAEPPRGTLTRPPSCPSPRSTRSDRVAFRSASAAAR